MSQLWKMKQRGRHLICQFQAKILKIHSLLCLCQMCKPDRKAEVSLLISRAAFPYSLHEQWQYKAWVSSRQLQCKFEFRFLQTSKPFSQRSSVEAWSCAVCNQRPCLVRTIRITTTSVTSVKVTKSWLYVISVLAPSTRSVTCLT